MNMRSIIQLVVEKADRVYHFHIPTGAPLGEALDAAYEILQKVHELGQQIVQNAEPVKQESANDNPSN